MKKAILLAAILFAVVFPNRLWGQPRTKPAPATKTTTSPAVNFFNQGLKCPKDDYDCQVSNYTKAINLKLETKEVFKNRGLAYYNKEEYEKAIADLTKANALDPNDAEILTTRSDSYLVLAGQTDEPTALIEKALKDSESAIELEPKEVMGYRVRSVAYLKMEDYPKALKDIDKALTMAPDSMSYFVKARILNATNDNPQALIALEKAIALDPKVPFYYEFRISIHEATNNTDLMIADYTKLISLKPDNAEYYTKRGELYYRQKKTDLTLKDFEQAIAVNPKAPEGYLSHAAFYLLQKDYEKAIADYTKLISLDAKNAEAYLLKRAKVFELFDNNKAIEDYSKVIELNGDLVVESFLGRAQVYQKLGKYEQALVDVNNLFKKLGNENFLDAVLVRMEIYYSLGNKENNLRGDKSKYQLAADDADEVLQIIPNLPRAREIRTISLYVLNKIDYAGYVKEISIVKNLYLENYTKAINANPTNPENYKKRGDNYVRIDGSDEVKYKQSLEMAVKDYTKAMELTPAKSAELFVARGLAYKYAAERGEFDLYAPKAISDLETANSLLYSGKPDESVFSNVLMNLPQLYAKQNNLTKAREIIDKAINDFPQVARVYAARAFFLQYTVKDLEGAAADYTKALELTNDDYYKILYAQWLDGIKKELANKKKN